MGAKLHQLGGEVREAIEVELDRSRFDGDVSPLDVAELAKPVAKSLEIGRRN